MDVDDIVYLDPDQDRFRVRPARVSLSRSRPISDATFSIAMTVAMACLLVGGLMLVVVIGQGAGVPQ